MSLLSPDKWSRWWNSSLPAEEERIFNLVAVALVYVAGFLTGYIVG